MIKITPKNRNLNKNLKKHKRNTDSFTKEKSINGDSNDYGIVLETKYNEVEVLHQNKVLKAKLAKTFKDVCNKVLYPGDKVILNNKDNTIIKIIARKNMLCREKHDGTKINDLGITKVIATNIDLAVIVVSAGDPPLHPKFIDRYLIILNSQNIPFIIVMNKCDLKTKKEDIILNIYKKLGIAVLETSTTKNSGIAKLKEILREKQTILVGHSGVGKSSLINAILQTNHIKVGSVGDKTRKGCHTTTKSKYYKWDKNSAIIDTPGIRSLDISKYDIHDIKNYFPEFNKLKDKCKYKDCLHYKEPLEACFIKKSVKNKLINQERYESYVKIISELYK